jgi:hypothetical protein
MFTMIHVVRSYRVSPSGRRVIAKGNISYRVKLLRKCVLIRGVLVKQRCDEDLGARWRRP